MSTLTERLDRLRTGSAERIPAEARAVMSRATEDLRASGIVDRLPAVGSKLPPFELGDTEGSTVRSGELLARGPLVVTFYRGLW